MPRNMSFAKTLQQMEKGTKTETRRLKWNFLKAGDLLTAVNKTMGLKKGEKPVWISDIRVTKTWIEPLNSITQAGCDAEGFPELTPDEFVEMFCRMNKCHAESEIRVIQFEPRVL